jgi:hypothetical protein
MENKEINNKVTVEEGQEEFCKHGNDETCCEVCHPELESDEDFEERMGN